MGGAEGLEECRAGVGARTQRPGTTRYTVACCMSQCLLVTSRCLCIQME